MTGNLRDMRERFARTSIGAELAEMDQRPGETYCAKSPLGHHVASDAARLAGVAETRCLCCRRRINGEGIYWRLGGVR